MITQRLRRAGNSYVVTIPRAEIERLGISEGDLVAVTLQPVEIRPVLTPELRAVRAGGSPAGAARACSSPRASPRRAFVDRNKRAALAALDAVGPVDSYSLRAGGVVRGIRGASARGGTGDERGCLATCAPDPSPGKRPPLQWGWASSITSNGAERPLCITHRRDHPRRRLLQRQVVGVVFDAGRLAQRPRPILADAGQAHDDREATAGQAKLFERP